MMDRWLTAIEADATSSTIEQKVIANKPADVHDGCYATPGNTAADLCSANIHPARLAVTTCSRTIAMAHERVVSLLRIADLLQEVGELE